MAANGGKMGGNDRVKTCPLCGGNMAVAGVHVSIESNMAVIDGSLIHLGGTLTPRTGEG